MVARIFHRNANKPKREIDSGSKKTTTLEIERERRRSRAKQR
jgi:hypothetical protein